MESKYDKEKSRYLINGFTEGFGIGYAGDENRRDTAPNLPLNELGTELDLWNKVMKEVGLGRYAGPYEMDDIPFKTFIQSPIGLVPKAGGQTRLIFHLSYDFSNGNTSVNANTPKNICSVKYKDLDHAIDVCLKLLKKHGSSPNLVVYFSKTDLKSAFRVIPVFVNHRRWLLIMAVNPDNGKPMYFIDKCLPFGASISCTVFQSFSDALAHIMQYLLQMDEDLTNYLDDFLFIALTSQVCDGMVLAFIRLCKRINCPIADEKTEWSTPIITFLGTLLDGQRRCLCIPEEKRIKALNQLRRITSRRKATIKEIQCLTGLLNFLNRAIVPGRVFTRRMYAKMNVKSISKSGKKLKQYHHISLDAEFRSDAKVWETFLENAGTAQLCRPFIDQDMFATSKQLNFFTDASGKMGYGCFFDGKWTFAEWDKRFLKKADPSIAFLELYALTVGLLSWGVLLRDTRFIIFCDNQAVVEMINSTTSGCKNCMYLLRLIVLDSLKLNYRVSVRYIESSKIYWQTVFLVLDLTFFGKTHRKTQKKDLIRLLKICGL